MTQDEKKERQERANRRMAVLFKWHMKSSNEKKEALANLFKFCEAPDG